MSLKVPVEHVTVCFFPDIFCLSPFLYPIRELLIFPQFVMFFLSPLPVTYYLGTRKMREKKHRFLLADCSPSSLEKRLFLSSRYLNSYIFSHLLSIQLRQTLIFKFEVFLHIFSLLLSSFFLSWPNVVSYGLLKTAGYRTDIARPQYSRQSRGPRSLAGEDISDPARRRASVSGDLVSAIRDPRRRRHASARETVHFSSSPAAAKDISTAARRPVSAACLRSPAADCWLTTEERCNKRASSESVFGDLESMGEEQEDEEYTYLEAG